MNNILKYFEDLSDRQLEQFKMLGPLYHEWNERINVISRKDIDSLYDRHVLHSLSLAALFEFRPGMHVIDIGCGGGFPGVPLAIFFPEVRFHLVDSIHKKLTVVNAIAESIGLTNITTQHTRAELIKDRKFDVAVSRAVAPLKDLLHWSRPLLKKSPPRQANEERPVASGLICLKGGDLAQEIHESLSKPFVWDIHEMFQLEMFKEKYVLQVLR